MKFAPVFFFCLRNARRPLAFQLRAVLAERLSGSVYIGTQLSTATDVRVGPSE
jgi:hypothetical protein